jgi:fused signal recognition particle receptor
MGFFDRLKAGLAKTRERLLKAIPWGGNLEEVLEELEMALLAADVGLSATEEILQEVRASGRKDLKEAVKEKLVGMLEPDERRATLRKLGFNPQKPKPVEPKGRWSWWWA